MNIFRQCLIRVPHEGTKACVCSESRLEHALHRSRVLQMKSRLFFRLFWWAVPPLSA